MNRTVAYVQPRRCTALTAAGQQCKANALLGAADGLCVRHTSDPMRSAGGFSLRGGQPTCWCGATKDEKGRPSPHRPGEPPCTNEVTRVVRVNEVPAGADLEGPDPSADLTFDGIDGAWLMFLRFVAGGGRLRQSAVASGLTMRKINNRRKADPSFAEAYDEAERIATERVEDSLYQLAVGKFGPPSMPAIQMWLANRAKDRWVADLRNVKHTYEGTVTHEIEAGKQMKHIAELMAQLEERRTNQARYALPQPVIDVEVVEP